MKSVISRTFLRIAAACVFVAGFAGVLSAQTVTDPNPNSPTPVLLSQIDSTYALAVMPDGPVNFGRTSRDVFRSGQTIRIFVRGITLMAGEGANAFRLYVEDAAGHKYRFPISNVARVPAVWPQTYALTVTLTDEIGYWGPPQEGDVLMGVTWRGLISNRVRLPLGQHGGRIKDDPGAVPTPARSITTTRTATSTEEPDYVGYRWSGDRMRFLEQATFGPTGTLDSRLRRIGLRTWLAEQFEAPYPSVNSPYPIFPLRNNDAQNAITGCGMFLPTSSPEYQLCFRDHYTMYQPQKWLFLEAFYGDAQLRHRVSWALAQIWVTSGIDVQQGRHMVEYHKILSNNAFGSYKTLIEQMTLNPTMGTYLDMAISTRNNPNENYARELMQLFTIGLFHLNQDGTLKLDAQQNPIPTYDQNGVNNLTKVLTGWQLCSLPAVCPNLPSGAQNYIDPMYITNTNNHDQTAKTLLTWPADPAFPPVGTNVPACTNCTNATNIRAYADASMDTAIDNIFYHPNVAPFVSKLMIQHMVTSDPTPAFVGRIAAVFNNNGQGIRGDMKAVVKAILLDPEARGDVKTDPNFGKLREPVQLATNLLRSTGVRSADGLSQSDGVIFQVGQFTGMGQLPFRSPTVFNFYPPDYGIPGTTLLGPEFALMTTGTSIQRANFINRMIYTVPPIAGGTVNTPNGTSLDFSDLQALAAADTTGDLLLDELDHRMMHNAMSSSMRNIIRTAITSIPATNTLARAQAGVHLIATSSQYQVQR